jgi:pimeloyl-ACP methyl ester carboxylesterase
MAYMADVTLYRSEAGMHEVMGFYDAILAHWPLPHEGLTLPTRYGDTFVIACGAASAPPLVLLHGASSNAVSWIAEAATYGQHFRVYAVDIIGEPGRSAPSRPPWTGPAYLEWMEDVLDGLKLGSVSLLGISQGAWIALKFAVNRPGRVSKLALLTPAGITPARLSFMLRAIPLTMLGKRGAEASNRIVFGRQSIHPDVLKYMNAIMTHFRPRISNLPLFTDAELRRLAMPVFLMVGEQDALYPSPRIAERLQRLLPDMHLIMDPRMGHVLFGVADRVLPFLQS